jgi:hypothetical protein
MAQNKSLRTAIAKAEHQVECLRTAMNEIENRICWSGFRDELPEISICSGYELQFMYQNKILPMHYALEYMEEYGYITPSDFMEF